MKKLFLLGALAVLFSVTTACGAKTSPSNEGEGGSKNAVVTLQSVDKKNLRVVDGLLIPEGMPCIVDFYATWCGPCKVYSPTFHEVAAQYEGQAIFISIDVDANPEIANKYEIQSIPSTVFILPGGGVMGKQTGIIPKDTLVSFVNQLMASNAGDGMGI